LRRGWDPPQERQRLSSTPKIDDHVPRDSLIAFLDFR